MSEDVEKIKKEQKEKVKNMFGNSEKSSSNNSKPETLAKESKSTEKSLEDLEKLVEEKAPEVVKPEESKGKQEIPVQLVKKFDVIMMPIKVDDVTARFYRTVAANCTVELSELESAIVSVRNHDEALSKEYIAFRDRVKSFRGKILEALSVYYKAKRAKEAEEEE